MLLQKGVHFHSSFEAQHLAHRGLGQQLGMVALQGQRFQRNSRRVLPIRSHLPRKLVGILSVISIFLSSSNHLSSETSLQSDKPLEEKAHNFPGWLRLPAILAGGLSGLAGFLVFGIVFCFVPIVLILGAIIQPYAPHLGRWVLLVGAMLVSVYVALFLAPQAFGAISSWLITTSLTALRPLSIRFVNRARRLA
jgi:hypothetical protein